MPSMASSYSAVLLLTSVITAVYAPGTPGLGDDGTYFQYMNVPGKYEYNFGFNRGNSEHSVSRYEQAKGHKFRSKVAWSDKHGGSGEQYWEYNHVDKGKKKGGIASYPPVSYVGIYGSSFSGKGSPGGSYGSLGSDFGGLPGGIKSGFGDISVGGSEYGNFGGALESSFGGLEGGLKGGFGDTSPGGLGGNDYGNLGGGLKSGFGDHSLGGLGGSGYGNLGSGLEGGLKSGFGDTSLGDSGGGDYGNFGGGLKSGFDSSNIGNSFGGLGSEFNTGSASSYGDLGGSTLGGGFNRDFGSSYGDWSISFAGLHAGLESGSTGGTSGGFPGFEGGFSDHGDLGNAYGGFPGLGDSGGFDGSHGFSGSDLKAGLGDSYGDSNNGGAHSHLPGIGAGSGDSYGKLASAGIRYKGNYDSLASGSSAGKVKSNLEVYYDRPGGKPIRTSVVKVKGSVGSKGRPPSSSNRNRYGVSKGRGKYSGSNKLDSSQRIKGVVVKVGARGSRPVKLNRGSTRDSPKQGPYEGVVYDTLGSESRGSNSTTEPPCSNQTQAVTNYGTFLSGYGKNSSTRNTRFRTSYHAPAFSHFPSALDHKDQHLKPDEHEEINQEENDEEEDYGEEPDDDNEEEYDTSSTDADGNKETENHEETEEEIEQSKDEEDPR